MVNLTNDGSPLFPLSVSCRFQSFYIHPEVKRLLTRPSLQKFLKVIQAQSTAMATDTTGTITWCIFTPWAPTPSLQAPSSFFHSHTLRVFLNFPFPPPQRFPAASSSRSSTFTQSGGATAEISGNIWVPPTVHHRPSIVEHLTGQSGNQTPILQL